MHQYIPEGPIFAFSIEISILWSSRAELSYYWLLERSQNYMYT